jgi:hypothetical protein
MAGQISGATKDAMRVHDGLVRGIPRDVSGILQKTHALTLGFAHVHRETEGVSATALGANARSVQANHLVEHLDGIHQHTKALAESTRGSRREMGSDEVKRQHARIKRILPAIRRNGELALGISGHIKDLEKKLGQLEKIYGSAATTPRRRRP